MLIFWVTGPHTGRMEELKYILQDVQKIRISVEKLLDFHFL